MNAYTQTAPTVNLNYLGLVILCYGLLLLFIVVDGLRHATSLKSFLLTLPHLVASYALVRSILDSAKGNHGLHTSIFFTGLLAFAAMA